MILNDLKCLMNECCDKTAGARIMRFWCKAALYLSYLNNDVALLCISKASNCQLSDLNQTQLLHCSVTSFASFTVLCVSVIKQCKFIPVRTGNMRL